MAKEAKKKEKKMKDNTNKKASNKDKRHFFKDVKAELKKVIWPTPKQLLNNTLAVIASVLIVGVIVFLLDLCFEKINTFGVEKLKTIVQSISRITGTAIFVISRFSRNARLSIITSGPSRNFPDSGSCTRYSIAVNVTRIL